MADDRLREQLRKVEQVLNADENDPKGIVGVSSCAGKEEITKIGRRMALKLHPDKFVEQEHKEKAEAAFKKYQDALDACLKEFEEAERAAERERKEKEAGEREREVRRRAQEERAQAERERTRREEEEAQQRAEQREAERQEEERKAEAERQEQVRRRMAEEQRMKDEQYAWAKAEMDRVTRERQEAKQRAAEAEAQRRADEERRNMDRNNAFEWSDEPESLDSESGSKADSDWEFDIDSDHESNSAASDTSWVCCHCTLRNPCAERLCQACGFERPKDHDGNESPEADHEEEDNRFRDEEQDMRGAEEASRREADQEAEQERKAAAERQRAGEQARQEEEANERKADEEQQRRDEARRMEENAQERRRTEEEAEMRAGPSHQRQSASEQHEVHPEDVQGSEDPGWGRADPDRNVSGQPRAASAQPQPPSTGFGCAAQNSMQDHHAGAQGEQNRERAQAEVISRRLVKRLDRIDGVFFTFSNGRTTALIHAVERGDNVVLQLLIDAGADVNKQLSGCFASGSTAMTRAAELDRKDDVQALLLGRADPNITNKKERTALLIASHKAYRDTALCLINGGADVNVKAPSENISPLLLWVDRSDVALTEALLFKGAHPADKFPDASGDTALIRAVQRKARAVVQCLCNAAHGRDPAVDLRDAAGYTALHRAIELADPSLRYDMVQILVETAKANLNECVHPETDRTPLICAVALEDQPVVELLIKRGSNVNLKGRDGSTALMVSQSHAAISHILLEAGADVNQRFVEDGSTVLARAAKRGDVSSVKMYLSKKAKVDIKDKSGCTALMVTSKYEISKLLVDAQADVNIQYQQDGSTVLSRAARSGNLECTKLYLEHNASVNVKEHDGSTALWVSQKYAISKLLLEKQADVNFQYSNEKTTVLSRAAKDGDTKLVELCLLHKAKVNIKDKSGCTALMVTSKYEISKLLVDAQADVNIQFSDKSTVLMRASEREDEASVTLFLRAGAQVDMQDNKGWSALMYAVHQTSVSIVKMLLQARASVDAVDRQSGTTPLMTAVQKQSVSLVSALLGGKDLEASLNRRDRAKERTALILAADACNVQITHALLGVKAATEIPDCEGQTALLVAARQRCDTRSRRRDYVGSVETMRALLRANANANATDQRGKSIVTLVVVHEDLEALNMIFQEAQHSIHLDIRDRDGLTPLILAAQQGFLTIAEALIRYGASLDTPDNEGATPLIYAVQQGDLSLVQVLTEAGADVNFRKAGGPHSLLIPVRDEQQDIIGVLLDHGAHVNEHYADGSTPLIQSVKAGSIGIAEFLLHANANVNDRQGGKTALMHALQSRNQDRMVQLVAMLAVHGAKLEERFQSDGMTPLIYGVKNERERLVSVLLEHWANVDATDESHCTSLSYAATNCNQNMVRLLLDCNANCDKADKRSETPIMKAARKGHEVIAEMLKSRGANISLRNQRGKAALDIAIGGFGLESRIAFAIDHFTVTMMIEQKRQEEAERQQREMERRIAEQERRFRLQQEAQERRMHQQERENDRLHDRLRRQQLALENGKRQPRGRGGRVHPGPY